MDIGTEFDDDFFEKPKEKIYKEPTDYEAKVRVPLWFMDNKLNNKEGSNALESLKHQADYHYFNKNYKNAAESYEHCLELTPASNNTWKREFMENLARSLLHIGDGKRALEWSLKLDESSHSSDQKVVSMNLLALVCHKLGKYEEELEALHCCLKVHKSSPEFWQRLALCYAGLFNIKLPAYTPCTQVEKEPCCAFSTKTNSSIKLEETDSSVSQSCDAQSAISTCISSTEKSASPESPPVTDKCEMCTLGIQFVSTCLVHMRMLMDTGSTNILGEERDIRIQEKISSSLAFMEVDQSFIDVASKMLGKDFLSNLQIQESSSETSSKKDNTDTST